MRHLLFHAAIGLLAGPVCADALKDRFLVAQQTFQDRTREFYVSRLPDLSDNLTAFLEDERAKAAMICAFDYIRQTAGEEATATYIVSIEELGAAPIASLEDLTGIPDSVPSEVIFGAMDSCNSIAISQQIMEDSGMMEAMRDPATLQRLMAPSDG